MKPVIVRGVRIGEGMPKIIAPIVGKDREVIIAEAQAIRASGADIVEWRIDWYEHGAQASAVAALAAEIRKILGEMPLLCTFRTQKEGGARAIEPQQYARLLCDICTSRTVDMIDVEAFTGEDIVSEIIRAAHENGVYVVASNHDFHATPDEDELLRRLHYMADIGADIPKIAVMPADNLDVLKLLRATARAAAELECPLITMSMGAVGVVSRLSGECFGSACTFGSVGQASAPGQIPVSRLRETLTILHQQ